MAEIVLKVGSVDPGNRRVAQDGDILCAFHDHRIQCSHARVICSPRDGNGRKLIDGNGFRQDPGGLLQTFLSERSEFRYERVSATELKIIRLSDMTEEIRSNVPDAQGRTIHLESFIRRRLEHEKASKTSKAIFGTPGAEVFYGGRQIMTPASLTTVWNAIETHTPKRRVDHRRWPLTLKERRHFLALPVDDFNDVEEGRLREREQREFSYGVTVASVVAAPVGVNRWRVTLDVDYRTLRPRMDDLDTLLHVGDVAYPIVGTFPAFFVVEGQPVTGAATVTGMRRTRFRRRHVAWRGLGLAATEADIDNRGIEVDVREAGDWTRTAIVQTRALVSDDDV